MSDEPGDLARARRLFDQSVERLDAATLSRLNRQRQKALSELDGRAGRWQLWLPAAGMAAAITLALVLWQQDGARRVPPLDAATDLDILMADEDLEMLEELEFFAWLESEEEEPAPDDQVG